MREHRRCLEKIRSTLDTFFIRFECGVLIREAHDPAVCVGSLDWNFKHLSGQDIGGSDAAADHGSTRAVDTGIRSLSCGGSNS